MGSEMCIRDRLSRFSSDLKIGKFFNNLVSEIMTLFCIVMMQNNSLLSKTSHSLISE